MSIIPLLISLALISYFAGNMSLTISCLIVIICSILRAKYLLNYLDTKGLNHGVILLTVAILIPIATGKINYETMSAETLSIIGVITLLAGFIVSLNARDGVVFLSKRPDVVTPLIIGTVLGVLAFQGIAVGPVIASGIMYFGIISYQKIFPKRK